MTHPAAGAPSYAYRWYVVFVLTVIYAANLIDRSMIAILQEPIKRDLGLSDSALGVMNGLAFALFYATLAVPIARIADRRSRIRVLAISLTVWCLATAASGFVTGFVTLLLCRMMVGAGEAGGYPPSAAMVSDYFPLDRRATAIALFGLGAPLGSALGLFIGGKLNDLIGWRDAFIVVGLGGLVLLPVLLLTVREPTRGMSDGSVAIALSKLAPPPFLTVVKSLWRLKSMRFLLIANMTHGFTHSAFASWAPTFYIRNFGFSPGSVAGYLTALATVGLAGTLIGGFTADRLGRRDQRWYLWLMALASVLTVPLAFGQFLADSAQISFAFAIGTYFLGAVFVGPTFAGVQSLVQSQVRATVAAIMLMMYNLFGLGLGPLVTGALSDLLASDFGKNSLSYALPIVMTLEFVAAGFYLLASRTFHTDMERDRTVDFA